MHEPLPLIHKRLSRFWIEISAVIIVLSFINGIILGLLSIVAPKAIKAAAQFSQSNVHLALITMVIPHNTWPTLPELAKHVSGNVMVDPSYEGILVNLSGKTFLVPTYADFGCTQKTRYYPKSDSYVHCVGTAYQVKN